MYRYVALCLLFSACNSASDPAGTGPATEQAESSTSAPEAGGSRTAGNIQLSGQGLQVGLASGTDSELLPFGTPAEQVVQRVTALLGGQPERSDNSECGAGPMSFATWPNGLQLALQNGEFVGWWLSAGDGTGPALPTAEGLTVGTSRTSRTSVSLELVESTLGTEFISGELSGLLSGPEADASVTDLWAGTSCVFR